MSYDDYGLEDEVSQQMLHEEEERQVEEQAQWVDNYTKGFERAQLNNFARQHGFKNWRDMQAKQQQVLQQDINQGQNEIYSEVGAPIEGQLDFETERKLAKNASKFHAVSRLEAMGYKYNPQSRRWQDPGGKFTSEKKAMQALSQQPQPQQPPQQGGRVGDFSRLGKSVPPSPVGFNMGPSENRGAKEYKEKLEKGGRSNTFDELEMLEKDGF
jgi:hypothetical protein